MRASPAIEIYRNRTQFRATVLATTPVANITSHFQNHQDSGPCRGCMCCRTRMGLADRAMHSPSLSSVTKRDPAKLKRAEECRFGIGGTTHKHTIQYHMISTFRGVTATSAHNGEIRMVLRLSDFALVSVSSVHVSTVGSETHAETPSPAGKNRDAWNVESLFRRVQQLIETASTT